MEGGVSERLQAEQSDLQRKLAIRDGKSGYAQNVVAIKARLAWIEEELSKDG